MIPNNIKQENIIKAIEEIEKVGIPKFRGSKKFFLEYNGKYYPPKYILSLANKYANGKELDSYKFGGGTETNNFLKNLGFNIVENPAVNTVKKPLKKTNKVKGSTTHHDERCPNCKKKIKELLEKIYGKVEQNYRFEIGTRLNDFINTPYYEKLKKIYDALRSYRGFENFVRARKLPACDFFVPKPGFVIEFDESQHFTEPRRIALENYPEGLKLGFDKKKWMDHCKKIKAQDNNPPYRDEQRAWYDTLRDFLPMIKNLKPTVRLYAKDYVWCSFDPNNSSDVERFKQILEGTSGRWEIEVREQQNPSIARVIIADEWKGNPEECKQLLENIYEKWPKGKKVRFLITCGGFIQFNWPNSISRNDIGDNKKPNKAAVNRLVEKAEECVNSVLDKNLCKKLSEVTDYITVGIDSFKGKVLPTQKYINQLHIELVFLKDLTQNNLYWTGKSYPTTRQQNGLVRIADLKTHFLDLDIGKVMILGCHDLSIFNPRAINASGWRSEVKNNFIALAQEEKPIYVLHHPHTTVKIRTWLNSWRALINIIQSVQQYAGSGRYYEANRNPSEWDNLDDVLEATKCCVSTIDFIIRKKY